MPRKQFRNIRRQEILNAAFEILKREGLKNTTTFKIAQEVGLSKGIIHHYFNNKQELIESTFRYAHGFRRIEVAQRLRRSSTPVERLSAVLSVLVDPAYLQKGFCRAWISFSAEAPRNRQLARLERVIHRRERSNLMHALRQFVTEVEADELALGIKALIEGARLRAALWSVGFDSAEVAEQVLEHVAKTIPAIKSISAS